MSNNQLSHLLREASSGGPGRENAERQLGALQKQNPVEYILGLCNALGDANIPSNVRQFAGILLGNAMEGDGAEDVQRGWGSYNPEVQSHIKSQVMAALLSPERPARKSAALIVAKIASVEFPNHQWQDLVPSLLQKIGQTSEPELCGSIVLCLKYLCEETDEMAGSTKDILEALKHCFGRTQPVLSMYVFDCLAATLDMFRPEIQDPAQRNDIMFMLCTAAGYQNDPKARSLGFMSLGKMANLYYDHMADYIPAIFDLTKGAIERSLARGEDEEVGRQAIEFWSITADVEFEISDTRDSRPCREFVARAVEGLVPMYLEFLKRQNDELTDETWTISKTAACSLEAFAKVSGARVLQHVGKFMEEHIGRSDWRSKEAAMCAFGLCINATTKQAIHGPLQSVLRDFIPRFLADEDPKIRRTTAWTLGLVCKYVPESIDDVSGCLGILGKAVNDVNAVSHYACWCIALLADNFGEQANNPISGQAQVIVKVLIERSLRSDADPKVVQSIHEAINNIIAFCNMNSDMVVGFLVEFIKRLSSTIEATLDPTIKASLLTAIYSSISVTIQKCTRMNTEISKHVCDQLMTCSIQLIQNDSDLVYEEALLSFSALCENIGSKFVRYLESGELQEILARSISGAVNYPHLCQIGAGSIGDIYRHGENMAEIGQLRTFTDKVVQCLLTNMVSEDLDIGVKSHVIDALSDVALSYGSEWKRYTKDVMTFCLQAGCFPLPSNADEYLVENFNDVRVSIMDVCRSSLLACQPNKTDLHDYSTFLTDIFRVLEIIAVDTRCSVACIQQCLRYLNEMIHAGLLSNCPQAPRAVISEIQQKGASARDSETRQEANTLRQLMARM